MAIMATFSVNNSNSRVFKIAGCLTLLTVSGITALSLRGEELGKSGSNGSSPTPGVSSSKPEEGVSELAQGDADKEHKASGSELAMVPEGQSDEPMTEARSTATEEVSPAYRELFAAPPAEVSEFLKEKSERALEAQREREEGRSVVEEAQIVGKPIGLTEVKQILEKNFLGSEAWRTAFNVDVGAEPAVPPTITRELLESESPLHPGQQVKDTHLLVLVPQKVGARDYTISELNKLLVQRAGVINGLLQSWSDGYYSGEDRWIKTAPAQSEWVLLPKGDLDYFTTDSEKHFFDKSMADQQRVLERYYPGYREVKAIEVATGALLNHLVNGESKSMGYKRSFYRTIERGGGVSVTFGGNQLRLWFSNDIDSEGPIGLALARKI